MTATRVLILGGGYVGLYTALTLRKKAGNHVDITLVDRRPYMTYQPFLPEAAAGSIEPRHVVVPLRRELKGVRIVQGKVTEISHAERRARVETDFGDTQDLEYDEVVIALGAIPRTLPIPGLKEIGVGFKWVEEAIGLRNTILGRIARAASTSDPHLRRRLLTFVFVGGGFAGIEAFAETEDMARAALRHYPELQPADLRFVMVEAATRILPEMGEEMGGYTLEVLRKRGMEIYLATRLESCEEGRIKALRWPGVRCRHRGVDGGREAQPGDRRVRSAHGPPRTRQHPAHPAGGNRGRRGGRRCLGRRRQRADSRPREGRGRLVCPVRAARRPPGTAAGREHGRQLAGRPVREYKHAHLGTVASLGLNKGVAQIMGVKAARLARVVHAPDLSHGSDPVLQPQGTGGGRLDHSAVLPSRPGVDGQAPRAAPRLQGSGRQ
ncbi:NADH dehydrogenase [Demequina litorisediminis]|uniref:NADH dehydrogenase n=1 Tax=Demequina litorisediminis TaxID=1849022 RepID=A0ABQ6IDW0_9MICO|nr:NADH dehydrogenase [Demequina litorisediminis]